MRRRWTGVRIDLARPRLSCSLPGVPGRQRRRHSAPGPSIYQPAHARGVTGRQVDRRCESLVNTVTLFVQLPAYLEFFEFGTATPDE
jgi:hypothetical protein